MKKQIEYGYARKGSKDKEAEEQLRALQEAGVSPEKIFVDQPIEKEKLKQLASDIRPGDVLVIPSLKPLGYSYNEILSEWTIFTKDLGAHIRVLDMELLDTSAKTRQSDSLVSDLFLQIFSFVAQQEREHIRRKQAEGIANARLGGRHLGRPRIPKPLKFDEMYDKWRTGVISAEEAMARLNLKRSTFERMAKERKNELKKVAEEKSS